MFRTITLPALRPAVVSAATVVFLFCATAFGIVLTLGGARYATVETEIWLLTTTLFDLQAAAALSLLQLVVVAVLLLAARRARTVAPTARRAVPPRRPGRGRRRTARGHAAAAALRRAARRRPRRRVAAGRRRAGASANYAALATTGDQQALLVPVTDALLNSLRIAVDATWMALGTGLLVALVVTRRSRSTHRAAGARACSTASSCCRWGSRR